MPARPHDDWQRATLAAGALVQAVLLRQAGPEESTSDIRRALSQRAGLHVRDVRRVSADVVAADIRLLNATTRLGTTLPPFLTVGSTEYQIQAVHVLEETTSGLRLAFAKLVEGTGERTDKAIVAVDQATPDLELPDLDTSIKTLGWIIAGVIVLVVVGAVIVYVPSLKK